MKHALRLAVILLCLAPLQRGRAAENATTAYSDPHYGFALRYPSNASIATDGHADGQLDMTGTAAVVVTPNLDAFKGTNLGEASVSVGVSNDPAVVAACAAGSPAQGEKAAGTSTIGGVKFSRFTFEDAAVGNRYASTIYRAVQTGRCYEIVEFIHWAVFENFSPGTVTKFDPIKIQTQLHAITRSFGFKPSAT